MQIEIEPKHIDSIESTSILQQTSFWAKVKQKQGCQPKAFDIMIKSKDLELKTDTDKAIRHAADDMLVLMYHLNSKRQLAYIPYGPILEPKQEIQGPYLEELSETIRTCLPGNTILIRYDLRWESHWSDDENRYNEENNWIGPPESGIQEMRINFNTKNWNLRKTISDNLPSNTVFLDLNEECDTILKRMKPKTRYNIRLSLRKGVNVREISENEIDIWYDLYRQTAMRNGILLHDVAYFKSVLSARNGHSKSPAKVYLLLAEYNNIPLAGMFLTISGKRATYLYGASSDRHRNLMATYALQWDAIKRAKSLGCNEYDMFGVSQTISRSHPLYGLYRFKTGFGGKIFHRMGCWDYPLMGDEYELFRLSELNSRGYHLQLRA
jgi:lipid II:glycine glycyltransferase (peptidoglycan interpeptide bridge formation enzyme)